MDHISPTSKHGTLYFHDEGGASVGHVEESVNELLDAVRRGGGSGGRGGDVFRSLNRDPTATVGLREMMERERIR